MTDKVLNEMMDAAVKMGRVEWGATDEKTSEEHAKDTKRSVEITEEFFGHGSSNAMHGLYIHGTDTVLCHTGTSPNSSTHARILTALWNRFIDEAEARK